MTQVKRELAFDLHRIGAVKFGEFTLKSGLKSPIYFDLRLLPSYPNILQKVAREMHAMIQGLWFDRIAGIPYAALPIATAVALDSGLPMIYPRKEVKEYGTRQAIEGVYNAGETVLVYDDLITTGKSKFEAIAPLEAAGLIVRDVVVVIDREQGGKEQLQEKGYNLHAALTMSELVDALETAGRISKEHAEAARALVTHKV